MGFKTPPCNGLGLASRTGAVSRKRTLKGRCSYHSGRAPALGARRGSVARRFSAVLGRQQAVAVSGCAWRWRSGAAPLRAHRQGWQRGGCLQARRGRVPTLAQALWRRGGGQQRAARRGGRGHDPPARTSGDGVAPPDAMVAVAVLPCRPHPCILCLTRAPVVPAPPLQQPLATLPARVHGGGASASAGGRWPREVRDEEPSQPRLSLPSSHDEAPSELRPRLWPPKRAVYEAVLRAHMGAAADGWNSRAAWNSCVGHGNRRAGATPTGAEKRAGTGGGGCLIWSHFFTTESQL